MDFCLLFTLLYWVLCTRFLLLSEHSAGFLADILTHLLQVSDFINCGVYIFTTDIFLAIRDVTSTQKDRGKFLYTLLLHPFCTCLLVVCVKNVRRWWRSSCYISIFPFHDFKERIKEMFIVGWLACQVCHEIRVLGTCLEHDFIFFSQMELLCVYTASF